MVKFCWHRWDVYVVQNIICDGQNTHVRVTKVCRECGKTKIKETVW